MTIYSDMMAQYNKFTENGGLFCLEYELKNGDYLLVDLQVTKYGLRFEFDNGGKLAWFEGCIQGSCGDHVIRWDKYFSDLDYYLEAVDSNIIEGFLIPNELYKG